ncbi:nucleotidyl transferase AbiEii/AbiGii toxin family protein [Candidatus Woesearchaeota archaeon]|nr:nucleotidyl transferase AbiEii/AbiGii toxin family protein [Candidatus Woesearchaeota archaeon]
MLTRKELGEYAALKALNLGNAEKDYLIDMCLLSISRHTKNELVFKGGICLYKFHKLGRFSQYMDFSAAAAIDIGNLLAKIVADFSRFGIAAKCQKKDAHNSTLASMSTEGPLFSGRPESRARMEIDVNRKSPVLLEPEALSYTPIYSELPPVRLLCMRQEEIFAEKVRALMTRQRARDLFDINHLLKAGVFAEKILIAKKMQYYGTGFEAGKAIAKIGSLAPYWKKELSGLVPSLPDFRSVSEYASKRMADLYR